MNVTEAPTSLWGWIAFGWATIGFIALLVDALYRLIPLAWEAMAGGAMGWWHWLALVGWIVFMGYTEGYKGFQKRFAPRFAARARHVADAPTAGRAILAPLFCMGLFHATKRVLVVSWSILIGVVLLIIAIRQLDQPWRGIIDAGVVIGLGWGLVATVGYLVNAARGRPLPSGPDVG